MAREISRRALLQSALTIPAVAAFAEGAPASARLSRPAGGQPRSAEPLRVPDLAIFDATIITMDERQPRAEALAVKNGRFLAVGSSRDVRAAIARDTPTMSLAGRTILPGLIDAHCHVASSGRESFLALDLGLPTLAAIRDAIRQETARRPKGEWIQGSKYDDAKTDVKRFLTRYDIDDVSPDHPILITDRSGHISIANSVALRLAGLTKDTPDPPGGKYDRDRRTGELTGVMREHAGEPVHRLVPEPTRAEAKRGAVLQCQAMARAGLTTVHDAQTSEIDLLAYQDALAAGELPIRVYALVQYRLIEHFKALNLRTGFGGEMLRIGPTKMVADGACAGRTMRMSTPYVGRPDDYGILTMTQEELDTNVMNAHHAGFQIGIHANGDVPIEMVLNAYEKALAAEPRPDARHRIEHCTLVNPHILTRMKRLGVIPTPFATYVYHHSDKWPDYGPERLEWMFAHHSFLENGIPVPGASDYIPGPFEPMMAFQSMVTRTGRDGKVWGPSQKITIDQAIRCYTVNGAYASFDEHEKGSITPGKLADLVVLGQDPTKVAPGDLMNVPIEKTMVGGRFVAEKN
jgi:predicted amidohydrolase YtcJ